MNLFVYFTLAAILLAVVAAVPYLAVQAAQFFRSRRRVLREADAIISETGSTER